MTTARDLSFQLAALLRREHGAMADFLVALADFDRKRLWVELGHSSLFYYLHRELGLSKGAAHYRKTAAELIQRFPSVVEPLRDGRLCFTSVVELAKVLTPENGEEVLPRFFHRSKREAMAEVAAMRPVEAPPSRTVVSAVRISVAAAAPTALVAPPVSAPSEPVSPAAAVQPVEPLEACPSPPPQPPRDSSLPLSADLARLHVTVSRRFLAKVEAARAALSHAQPGATAEQILEAGLDLLLAQHAKRKGLVARPLATPRPAKADHVPAHVRREVRRGTRDAASTRSPRAGFAARPTGSRSTTSSRALSAERRPPKTSPCAAASTTTSRHGATSGTASWIGSHRGSEERWDEARRQLHFVLRCPRARHRGAAGPTLLFDAIRSLVRAHAPSDRAPVARSIPGRD
jgi:hypothetical protein